MRSSRVVPFEHPFYIKAHFRLSGLRVDRCWAFMMTGRASPKRLSRSPVMPWHKHSLPLGGALAVTESTRQRNVGATIID
jgi:hypothetical protein